MHAAFAGGVLGRQAERVPAHRMHDREAARPLVAGDHVAQGVVAHMAHVDLAAGIGKHLQHVVFRLAVRRHIFHAEAGAFGPGLLPFRFGGGEVVARAGFRRRRFRPRRSETAFVHGRMYRAARRPAQVPLNWVLGAALGDARAHDGRRPWSWHPWAELSRQEVRTNRSAHGRAPAPHNHRVYFACIGLAPIGYCCYIRTLR